MKKSVVSAGVLGGMVMFFWLFVSNAMLPIKGELIHRELPFSAQLEVHQALKGSITDPGTYSIPYLSPQEEDQFPDYRDQPVFSVTYEGYSHSGVGGIGVFSSFPVVLLAIFLPALIAAWMLSLACSGRPMSYPWRFLFVLSVGVIIALHDDVLQMSFGPQGKDYLAFLAANNILAWALSGAVIAGVVKFDRDRPKTE
jgi:hypothetical protein